MMDREGEKVKWNLRWEDLRDKSVWTLTIWNIIVMFWSVHAKLDGLSVMLLFVVQNLIIGFFWFVKILMAQNLYSKNPFDPEARPVPAGFITRLAVGISFFVIFTVINAMYAEYFLIPLSSLSDQKLRQIIGGVAICGLIFFGDQLFFFIKDRGKNDWKWAHIRKVMYYPFIRVVPMHLMMKLMRNMIFAQAAVGETVEITPQAMVFFLMLKTVADVFSLIVVKKGFGYEHDYGGLSEDSKIKIQLGKSGKELVLSDGSVITLSKDDRIEQQLKAIENLPAKIRQEVLEKLLIKRGAMKQPEAVKCRCGEEAIIRGESAKIYSSRHLTFVKKLEGGATSVFCCPDTGVKWMMVDDVLCRKYD